MIKATLLQLVGAILTVYVLAHSQEVWKPFTTWGLGTTDGGTWMYGVMSAGFTWLGFYVPQLLVGGKPQGETAVPSELFPGRRKRLRSRFQITQHGAEAP